MLNDAQAVRKHHLVGHDHNGSMLLKESSAADQNFPRPLMRFSDNYVRDLVSWRKNSQATSTTAWVPY